MILSYVRTVILYLTMIVVIRIMGKRQIGQMEPSEFVVTMMVANLATIPMEDDGIALFAGFVPICVILGAELVLSWLNLKSSRIRRLLCGKPVILIENGNILQQTEDLVGPYELHDFFLYYMIRFGFAPRKIYELSRIAFKDAYDEETIKKWLRNFYRRFFNQQFKRNCMPDGVKIGSIALSPRGDWRMPSDAESALWLSECGNL